jgi:hypothetical protein
MDVGGIRVSHLSHIAKPMTLVLAVSKGKRAPYVVQPLADAAPAPISANRHHAGQLKPSTTGLTGLGITDRDAMLATVAQVIDREIASAKDLTPPRQ